MMREVDVWVDWTEGNPMPEQHPDLQLTEVETWLRDGPMTPVRTRFRVRLSWPDD